ncbi:unnamed protein product [Thlaspi arvense]|uniref:NYN domain-containing protein n=1 Tax=Thlaspi arvense TaxID=13288 RepID=A0AAU9S8Z5_THLAR|nr:unnamed protein product [Thlaspi arvense]
MRRRPVYMGTNTNVYWNADSWLSDRYNEPCFIIESLFSSLFKKYRHGHHITAYGDAVKVSDDLTDGYYLHLGFYIFEKRGSEDERFYLMLVKAVQVASIKHRTVIIAKLSQDSAMICRVLASLRNKGCSVVYVVPELDVDKATPGITVSSERNDTSVPVWPCPHLFDREPGVEYNDSERYFIEPPAPEAHTVSFTMPLDVDTSVFWDVEDYPFPPGLDLSMFYENIAAAVRARVLYSTGGVSIYAYVAKEEEFGYRDRNGNHCGTQSSSRQACKIVQDDYGLSFVVYGQSCETSSSQTSRSVDVTMFSWHCLLKKSHYHRAMFRYCLEKSYQQFQIPESARTEDTDCDD